MSPKVAILLANGFEEAEAFMIFNALKRVKIDVEFLSCSNDFEVLSYHNVIVKAHGLLKQKNTTLYDAIVLPGGPEGTVNLGKNGDVINFIKLHDENGKLICPICSAAIKVLGKNKLLKGRQYTCSGDLFMMENDGVYLNKDIVIDANLFSGQGLGYAYKFAFTLAKKLGMDEKEVQFQAEHIYLYDI
ncbi:DJ-1/PfpI family protein [Orbus mooreae]|uniref:DJ-1/PfpI family protein n=1 Tax=Orbus mooreae TaxID=3074107 RepID=UPI00370D43BF